MMKVIANAHSYSATERVLVCLLVLASSVRVGSAQSPNAGTTGLSPIRSLYLQFGVGRPFLTQPAQFKDGWHPDASLHLGMVYFVNQRLILSLDFESTSFNNLEAANEVGLPINPELTNLTFLAGLAFSRRLWWLQPYTRLSGGPLRAKQRRLNVSDGAFEYNPLDEEIKWASGFGVRLAGGLALRPTEEWAVIAEINHTRGRVSETWLGYTTIRLTLAVAPWNFGAAH